MDFTADYDYSNQSETVLSGLNGKKHVIPHIRQGHGPVPARKYPSFMESNSIIKNKNVLRKINFLSGDYLDPMYVKEASAEQFSFLELYCNKDFHENNNKLKCIDKCRKDYPNKKYGCYADVLRFASQLPFMEVDVNSKIIDSMQQNHLKNFEKHTKKKLNFSAKLCRKEQFRNQFENGIPLQNREGNALRVHEQLDRDQNAFAVSQNILERSSQASSEGYSVIVNKNQNELSDQLKMSENSVSQDSIDKNSCDKLHYSDFGNIENPGSHSILGDSSGLKGMSYPSKEMDKSIEITLSENHDKNEIAEAISTSEYLDKSKDFFDDAIMEHVRHHLLQLSSVESVVTTGPPSAITFHSSVAGKRVNEVGKVHFLLHWSPENIVPDTWVAEDELCYNTQKTIPVSQLPPEALQPPVMEALGISGISPRPGKRKRK